MDSIFGETDKGYRLLSSTTLAFGEHLVSEHAKRDWTLIAKYPKTPKDGDGQDVEVYCAALPAAFFLIKALPTPNSMNEIKNGFQLSTGTGMEKLVDEMATAISAGMLALNTDKV